MVVLKQTGKGHGKKLITEWLSGAVLQHNITGPYLFYSENINI